MALMPRSAWMQSALTAVLVDQGEGPQLASALGVGAGEVPSPHIIPCFAGCGSPVESP